MSTLTMKEVAPYTDAFKAKYNRDTTLSLDDIEAIIEASEPGMTEADFAEAFKEAETDETDDRSQTPAVIEAGSAWDYARKMNDEQFQADLETNAQAALENKRGAAVIRRDLVRLYGEDVIAGQWPIPGSTEKTNPGSNRLDKYSRPGKDANGESKMINGSWYADLFDGSDAGKALETKLTSVKAAKAGETGKHILPEHAAMAGDDLKLTAEKSMLEGMRTNKKNAIVRAVKLIQYMSRLNDETEASVELITEDGKPEGEPVKSNKLIYLYNGKDRKQFRVLTIGQLLALDIDKAKGSGGTYTAVIGTTGRAPKSGTGTDVANIEITNVKEFDDGMAAFATFFDKLVSDSKATVQLLTHLNGAGTDDLLLSMNSVAQGLDAYLSKPGISKRLANLLADGNKKVA